MSEWFYARDGRQVGPISFEDLVGRARAGELGKLDLVWTTTMKDWQPASQVEGIFPAAGEFPTPVADPNNPYAAPVSGWNEATLTEAPELLDEIVPGSEPIDIGKCVKRGFELTTRNFGMILLVGIIYVAVSVGVSAVLTAIDSVMGWGGMQQSQFQSETGAVNWQFQQNGSLLNIAISQLLSVFLSLGLTRIGLNLVSGKEISIGMLFGGGKKLLTALGATVLFAVMVGLGFVLLIVPGIYLALRYGQYMTAIVDRNLGIIESFQYSSRITTGNRTKLFLLILLSGVIAFAGMLVLCVGLAFALPVAWLSWIVAYRWMQVGSRAVIDRQVPHVS